MTKPQEPNDVFVHPTAIIENQVTIGAGTKIWDNVHVRGPSQIGEECLIGGKSTIAYDVVIGHRCKLNSAVYLPALTRLGDGVFVGAGTIFTNDRHPRATHPDLGTLQDSTPNEHTLSTVVADGASFGARCVIGPGLRIGRFAMVGMGSVVTRDVEDFRIVAGHPARTMGVACRCGSTLLRHEATANLDDQDLHCEACDRRYRCRDGRVEEA